MDETITLPKSGVVLKADRRLNDGTPYRWALPETFFAAGRSGVIWCATAARSPTDRADIFNVPKDEALAWLDARVLAIRAALLRRRPGPGRAGCRCGLPWTCAGVHQRHCRRGPRRAAGGQVTDPTSAAISRAFREFDRSIDSAYTGRILKQVARLEREVRRIVRSAAKRDGVKGRR